MCYFYTNIKIDVFVNILCITYMSRTKFMYWLTFWGHCLKIQWYYQCWMYTRRKAKKRGNIWEPGYKEYYLYENISLTIHPSIYFSVCLSVVQVTSIVITYVLFKNTDLIHRYRISLQGVDLNFAFLKKLTILYLRKSSFKILIQSARTKDSTYSYNTEDTWGK